MFTTYSEQMRLWQLDKWLWCVRHNWGACERSTRPCGRRSWTAHQSSRLSGKISLSQSIIPVASAVCLYLV